ncbi:hypothetical protein M501DRAFT_926992 [Patellaria atrata CBS 101060]|uniref:DnaJ homologue subfamily C member 28 conserved domain-containing protein n=1 Tax=Patellaria atrata CBS 101060 TaxID=1346257 RepID=A0A9P4VQJ2_9PEZI|nr:hypothetical protein M501DRAFT_926992 [Patellaria atrata CBS 101060]
MSRRLSELTDEVFESSGSRASKTISEAGFDEDLRKQLEERIASADFKNKYANQLAQMDLPSSAGRGTRDIAGAAAWTGTESTEDAALRMLTDAHKPLRGAPSASSVRGPPVRIDTGRARSKPSMGTRLANARDRTSIYAILKDNEMTKEEREAYTREMKERFQPHARAVPATIQGLASLANERIEDAIARGQFKNLPRGKRIERDYNASSPFIDTTEYLLNKIIQKQDIVPPWIEKQQELASAANKFRGRLRNDWKRHAARMIASEGGTLQDQVQRAEAYAAAEAMENPPKRNEETIHAVDEKGHMSQITLSGELKAAIAASEETPEGTTPTGTETTPDSAASPEITITETPISQSRTPDPTSSTYTTVSLSPASSSNPPSPSSSPSPSPSSPTLPSPFRDSSWLATESSYHTLAINNLNNLTRTYNLMAPDLAKKPYYDLQRELRSCYADIAPQLPGAILERATRPKRKVKVIGHREGSILERFSTEQKGRVYDEKTEKRYGFKEFWKDLFGGC